MNSIFRADQVSAPGLVSLINSLGTDLVGCELGVSRGSNLRYILDLAPVNRYVYAIDPWLPYQDWNGFVTASDVAMFRESTIENLYPYNDIIKVLEMKSDQAKDFIKDYELNWIFIDGAHDYESVLTDCVNYYNKVCDGGLFSGHDYQLPDVNRAVNDFKAKFSIDIPTQFTETNVWYWYK